jgi:radical SAM protein with 4Fe4S-binding SPASM domain
MMDCVQTTLFNDERYLERLNKKIEEERIPFSGSISPTHRCNLRCIHCYLGPHSSSRPINPEELNTGQIRSLLDEITEAGCLFLLITGGEPLLRKDFPEIFRHAKGNGLIPTVFTNGTLITESVAELFRELPPYSVEISLYGATASTYETITGVKGSYELCMRGIQLLLINGINVQLKTMLMTLNSHEFFAMKDAANHRGVRFRFDAALFSCLNGDKTPLSFRVPPEDAVQKEFSDPARYKNWQDQVMRQKETLVTDDLYICGAGSSTFHIDPYGNLQPCLMTHTIRYNLPAGNFLSGWYNIQREIREKKVSEDFPCKGCGKVRYCNYCPAFFLLENGKNDSRSEYLCRLGSLRYDRLHHIIRNEG